MRILIAALLLGLPTACASKAPEYYVPPTSVSAEGVATIVGSRVYRESDFEGDLRIFLWGVDRKIVSSDAGRERWSEVIPVAPGLHEITIHAFKGGFPTTGGSQLMEVTLEAGRHYRLVATYPEDGEPPIAWLENEAGERVSPRVYVPLQAGSASTVIVLP